MSAIEASSVGVKTMADGTLRITLDIEPRHAKDAFGLFGSPGTAVALAALKTQAQQAKEEKPKGGALAKLAGMWCQDPAFQKWILPVYDRVMGGDGSGCGDVEPSMFDGPQELARHCILVICDVESRADLDHSPIAATRFDTLIRLPFKAHLDVAPRRVAAEATA